MSNNVYFPHMGTVKDAADASGLAVSRIRKLVAAGTVRSVRAGRRILVNLDSLSKYLDAGDPPEPQNTLPGISRIKQ